MAERDPVRAFTQRISRARGRVVWVQALLVGAAQGLAVLAACAASRAAAVTQEAVVRFEPEQLLLAAASALALALAYAREVRCEPSALALAIDAAGSKDLAFATAYERGGAPSPGPFDRELAARALEGLRARTLCEAVVPSSGLAAVAPLVCGAALFLGVAAVREAHRPAESRELVRVAAQELAGALGGAPGETADSAVDSARDAAVSEAQRLSERLAHDLERGDLSPSDLEALDRALARLSAADPAGERARAVERARSALDAARPEGAARAQAEAPEAESGDVSGSGEGEAGEPGTGGAGGLGADARPASDPPEMSGGSRSPAGSEVGRAAVLTLPLEQRRLVEAWVEAERQRAAGTR